MILLKKAWRHSSSRTSQKSLQLLKKFHTSFQLEWRNPWNWLTRKTEKKNPVPWIIALPEIEYHSKSDGIHTGDLYFSLGCLFYISRRSRLPWMEDQSTVENRCFIHFRMLATKDLTSHKVSVYPNPSTGDRVVHPEPNLTILVCAKDAKSTENHKS